MVLRILYSHRIQSRDGQGVHVEAIVDALRQAGHEVLLVGPRFYEQTAFGGESRLVARLRAALPGALGELAELAYNIPAYWRLSRACQAFRPQLIYERANLFYLAGAWAARRHRVRFFVEVNAPLAEERARYGALRLQRLARAAESWVWRSADQVLTVTGVLRDRVSAAGVAPTRIEIMQNGIDPARFTPAPPRPASPVVLGFVGFVRDWHGLDRVIAGLAQDYAANLRLVVVGDGPALPALAAQVAALGLGGRVQFTGLATPAAVPALLATFDIALQPRVVAYASPLKIFEYMAAGCAIVAPDQPNIREILQHDQTALLFDPNAADGIWPATLRLAADPALRARLGAAARAEIARCDYTWAGNAARIVALANSGQRKTGAHPRPHP